MNMKITMMIEFSNSDNTRNSRRTGSNNSKKLFIINRIMALSRVAIAVATSWSTQKGS